MKDESARKILKYNRKCIDKIRNWIEKEDNLEKRMDLIEFYLHFCTNNVTGIYSDPWIEKKLLEYSARIEFEIEKKPEADTALIVMTEAAATGGHTALVNNWILFDSNRKYSIVLTECSEKRVPEFLKKTVRESGGEIIFLSGNDKIVKAKELLQISQHFEKVFLFIHMYDVIPVIAYGHKNWKQPIYFYNHADFLFSVGMSVSDFVFTLNEYDNKRAIENRGAVKAEVLPFPQSKELYKKNIQDSKELKKQLGEKYGFDGDSKIVLTMGSEFKFIKTEDYDFGEFVKQTLSKASPNTRFFLIGADPDNKRWTRLCRNTHNKARALGVLPREKVSEWMQIADAYITSFPMTSAGSGEARANHVPNFRFSPTSRANEYVPSEEIYDSIEEMEDAVVKSLRNEEHIDYEIPWWSKLARDKERWCQLLNGLLNNVQEHKVYDFKSVSIIDIQEIINVQLLKNDNYPYGRTRRLGLIKWVKIKKIVYMQKWLYFWFELFQL